MDINFVHLAESVVERPYNRGTVNRAAKVLEEAFTTTSLKWVRSDGDNDDAKQLPTELGLYRVMIAGDRETDDMGGVIYDFDDYETWATVTAVDETGPSMSFNHDEDIETMIAWYGPIHIPPVRLLRGGQGMKYANEKECRAAGLNPVCVERLASRMARLMRELDELDIIIFGGTGGVSLRFGDGDDRKLVVANCPGENVDGGDGAEREDDDGLLRGE